MAGMVLAYISLVRWLPIHIEPPLSFELSTTPADTLARAVS
jgi:hypothetical protein